MKIETKVIPGVLILKPQVYEDERGFFLESYNKQTFVKIGINQDFVQDSQVKSLNKVVRGLHYQKNFPQGKLVRVLQGSVLDVIVDIRVGSPTFGKWIANEISADNWKQIWIPGGLAHGYSVLSESAELFYKLTDFYHPEDEKGIRWNDPELGIKWQVSEPIISKKDSELPFFKDTTDYLPRFKADSF